MKNIILIPHAERRLDGYSVDGELIVDAINNPDEVVRGKRKGELQRWVAHRLLNDE